MSFRRRLMMKFLSTSNLIDYFNGYKVESQYGAWYSFSWSGSRLLMKKNGGSTHGVVCHYSVANRSGSPFSTGYTPGEASIGYESGKSYNLKIKVVGKAAQNNYGKGTLQFIFNGYDSTTNEAIKRESELIVVGDMSSGSEFNISINAGDILNGLSFKYTNLTSSGSGADAYFFDALFEFYFEETTNE